jgi:hypothetical protein
MAIAFQEFTIYFGRKFKHIKKLKTLQHLTDKIKTVPKKYIINGDCTCHMMEIHRKKETFLLGYIQ